MDTLLHDLRSALQMLGEHPAFTLAAAMSLGFGLEAGALPDSAAAVPRDRRHAPAPAAHAVAAPRRTVSWMDYIDFRGGSGDVLRGIGGSVLSETRDTCEPSL